MRKDFVVKAKTYLVKHIEKPLYLDYFGFMNPFGDLTERFDTKKKAQLAYKNGHTASCCIIIEEVDRKKYE